MNIKTECDKSTMGGSYYDREIEVVPVAPQASSASSTSNSQANSTKADSLFEQNHQLHPTLDPKNRTLKLSSPSLNPIVVAVDVTGSMGIFAKCIWDKLPMFYGQLRSKGYLDDPAISFAGVGDSHTDKAPLQIAEFRQGSALDNEISNLFLEGGGGGQHYESYELAAYFYDKHYTATKDDLSKSFFFFIGDEGFYAKIKADHVQKIIGDSVSSDIDSAEIFASLRRKFHVFFIHKPYWDKTIDSKQLAKWKNVVGADRVLELVDPKSIVDIMLGAIAVVGRTRTLEQYTQDLEARGQTEERIASVRQALKVVYETLDSPTFPPPGAVDSNEPPKHFICPITQELMEDPVKCSDGHSYERDALDFWFSSHDDSPVTGEAVISKEVIPDNQLKQAIQSWKSTH